MTTTEKAATHALELGAPAGSGSVTVNHEVGSGLTVSAHGVELLKYEYAPQIDAFECPAPYFHPLRNLAGDIVTGNRPHDHRWHKGFAMTVSHLSGENFWGGPSYTPGAPGHGYVSKDNVGSLIHTGFSEFSTGDSVRLVESVDWRNSRGESWVDEKRTLTIADVDADNGSWSLNFETELTNVRGENLDFGSPTVFGRAMAGYCGLFWRGPREFAGGTILASGNRSGTELMGEKADWLAYVGQHDGSNTVSTLIFDQDAANADAPAHWFVRNEPYAVVNPSLAFFEGVTLAPGDTLRRRYRLIIASAAWDHARIESHLAATAW